MIIEHFNVTNVRCTVMRLQWGSHIVAYGGEGEQSHSTWNNTRAYRQGDLELGDSAILTHSVTTRRLFQSAQRHIPC
jgi:hypothetical protein